MTSFILKLIGILSMLCDHIGLCFGEHVLWLNFIGRIAFPIFAFQIAQGYIHTSNLKKYTLRLFIFACISQVPFMLFGTTYNSTFVLNIFFTFLLGILAIYGYEEINNKFAKIIFVILTCGLAQLMNVDYYAYGVASIFLFYFFSKLVTRENISKNKIILYKVLMCICFIALTFIKYLEYFIKYPSLYKTYLLFMLSTYLALVPILLYNGKKGPNIKYLFYVFYPLHLLVLWFISIIH